MGRCGRTLTANDHLAPVSQDLQYPPLIGWHPAVLLTGRGHDNAANAALRRIRDHCAENDVELVRVENFNDHYPEEQRSDFSLTRFSVGRPQDPGPDSWALPTGLPTTTGRSRSRRPANRRRTAA